MTLHYFNWLSLIGQFILFSHTYDKSIDDFLCFTIFCMKNNIYKDTF